jgi:chromate transporter
LVSQGALATSASSVLAFKQPGLLKLFMTCFFAGAFTFGTGLAVLPVLQGEFVEAHHWITHEDFLNAVVIGQITPGPVLITSTVLGFMTKQWLGAIFATLGAFLPAFLYGLIAVPRLWAQVKSHPLTPAFTAGALPAVVGAMVAVTFKLFPVPLDQLQSLSSGLMAAVPILVATALLLTPRIPIWLTIPLAAIASLALQLLV